MAVSTRVFSFLFVLAAIAFAIAAVSSIDWIVDNNVNANSQATHIGLNKWLISWSNNGVNTDTGKLDFNDPLWTQFGLDSYIGKASSYKAAGTGALALGIIGIIFAGLAAGTLILSRFTVVPATYLSAFGWFAGFAFVLGAILYEAIRPTFHGDIGYQWPYGLYLTSGIFCDVAAYVVWYGASTDPKAV